MATQFAVDEINAQGGLLGKKVELFDEDSQLKPDIAARKALKAVMQDGATVIMQNISTAVAQAIMNIAKEEQCSPGKPRHLFGFDSPAKISARIFSAPATRQANSPELLPSYFATKPYRKFYLINMDYVFGHAVADDFVAAMKKAIPDVQIVGNDFHPIATKDFAPYISKIIASGAEIVYTGNYGTDLETLMKHAAQLGMKAGWASNRAG